MGDFPIKLAHRRKFERICDDLHKLVRDIEEYVPAVCIYVAGGSVYLMHGPTHDERGMMQDINISVSSRVRNIKGGGY